MIYNNTWIEANKSQIRTYNAPNLVDYGDQISLGLAVLTRSTYSRKGKEDENRRKTRSKDCSSMRSTMAS